MFYFLSGGPFFSGGSGAANSHISSIPSYYLNCSSTADPQRDAGLAYRERAGIPVQRRRNLCRCAELR